MNPGSVFARQLTGISHGLSVIIIIVFTEIKNKYLDLDMELESWSICWEGTHKVSPKQNRSRLIVCRSIRPTGFKSGSTGICTFF